MCIKLLGERPVDDVDVSHFPRAVTPDGTQMYGTGGAKVTLFTWPDMDFVSVFHHNPGTLGIDVTISPAGDVFVAETPSSTTVDIYKNGAYSGLSITVAATISGGGLAFADGWLWCLVSTNAAGGSGALYRMDPDTFATTTPHTVTGFRLAAFPHAATDGAVWYTDAASTTVYRHLAGSTTSAAFSGPGTFVPRPDGVMLAYRNSPAGYVDIDPSLTISAPTCDPIALGAELPLVAFNNPSLTDVGLTDNDGNVYRLSSGRGWWLGVAGWG